MEHHSVERSAVIVFAKNIFPAGFRQKMWNFGNFPKPIRHSALPYAFLNFNALFVQKWLEDPLAYCLAALETFQLTGAEFFGSRNFSTGEFLAKIFENPDFFRGQVLLFLNSLPWYPMYGILILVRRWNTKS